MNRTIAIVACVFVYCVASAVSTVTAADAVSHELPPAERVAQYLQEVSVTLKSGYGEGSGVIFTRVDDETSDTVNFIWTAGHCVESLREEDDVVVNGSKKKLVRFKDASIVQELTEAGRRVGEVKMEARVIRYSDSEYGDDLALLEVRKRDFVRKSCVFYLDDTIPAIGTRLYHVGSLQGQMGANSMTNGIMSQIGRLYKGKIYDQTTVSAFPGSSGGGVYREDGRYVGMVTRGSGETFNLIVPVRRIRKWAETVDCMWALDPTVAMPNEKGRTSAPIEDVGTMFKSGGGGGDGDELTSTGGVLSPTFVVSPPKIVDRLERR